MPPPDESLDSSDDDLVAELLGRRPQGDYHVVVRRADGNPVVIANAPLLYSGRPMPTRYWLIDKALNKAIGTLESTGAVDRVEAEIPVDVLNAAHAAYAAERDALVPADHDGPVPYGGVGGTRIGVKCLHAHYAYFLAGGDDPVGAWVDVQLAEAGAAFRPTTPVSAVDTSSRRAAVIDIGSGSSKLVVTDGGGQRTSRTVFTGLVAGVSSKGVLSEQVEESLRTSLIDLCGDAAWRAATERAVIATAAVRRITDQAGMADLVRDATGHELEVLSAAQEARYALAGAIGRDEDAVDHSGPVAVFDIGAGSTEFAHEGAEGIETFSIPLGAVDVTTTYLHSDPPRPDELSAALSVIELYLTDLRREVPGLVETFDRGTVLAIGANLTIARVEIGTADPAFPLDGVVLTREAAEDLFRTLVTETIEDRAYNPGMPPEHVVDIVGAMCLLVEFMRQFGVDEMIIRQRGVADGRALALLGSRPG